MTTPPWCNEKVMVYYYKCAADRIRHLKHYYSNLYFMIKPIFLFFLNSVILFSVELP